MIERHYPELEGGSLKKDLLELMYETNSDYTGAFVRLTELVEPRLGSELAPLPDATERVRATSCGT